MKVERRQYFFLLLYCSKRDTLICVPFFIQNIQWVNIMIRVAGNTQIPILWVIENRYGYKTYLVEPLNWVAVKGEHSFSATCPEELLGLIVMYNELGDNWREAGDSDFFSAIMEREYK